MLRVVSPFCVLVLGHVGTAGAQPSAAEKHTDDQVQELSTRAKKLCASDRPKEGVEVLAELYVSTGHPTWIYNQGRCWEANGNYGKALSRFEEYLRKAPDLSEPERRAVQGRMHDLEGKVARGQEAKEEAEPMPVAPAPAAAVSESLATQSAPPAPIATQDAGWPLRKTLGVSGVTIGGAAVVTGFVFQLVANSRTNAFNAANCGTADLDFAPGCSQRNGDIDGARSVMWAGYISGAALVGLGTYLWVTASPSDTERTSRTPRFACNVSGGLTGIACNGRF